MKHIIDELFEKDGNKEENILYTLLPSSRIPWADDILLGDNLHITALRWPRLSVSSGDLKIIEDHDGQNTAIEFLEGIRLRTRNFVYAAIAVCIRGDTEPVAVRRRLRMLGYTLDPELLVPADVIHLGSNYVEIASSTNPSKLLLLSNYGVRILNHAALLFGMDYRFRDHNIKEPANKAHLEEMYTKTLNLIGTYRWHRDEIIKWREMVGITYELIFPKRAEELSMCTRDQLLKMSNTFTESRALKADLLTSIQYWELKNPNSQYESPSVEGMRKVLIDVLGFEEGDLDGVGRDRLERTITRSGKLDAPRGLDLKSVPLKLSEARKVEDICCLGRGDGIIDSRAFFNCVQNNLLKEIETKEGGGYDVYYLGDVGQRILQSPEFRYDWLDMSPEIRRLLSEQGICPVGIGLDEKIQCEATWKASGSVDKVCHKDVDGIRLEISNTRQRLYVWPRTGNLLKKEDCLELISELDVFRDALIGVYNPPFQDGFEYKTMDDGLQFNHKGSRWITFPRFKMIAL